MAKILLAFFIVACFGKLGVHQHFDEFLIKHNKFYSDEEYFYRASIFSETLKQIEAHNADPSKALFFIYFLTLLSKILQPVLSKHP